MNALLENSEKEGDLVRLSGSDEYAAYFNHMKYVFQLLIRWYERSEGGDVETEVVTKNLKMLLATIGALRLRQLHDSSRNLALDLNESGFPHSIGLSDLEVDIGSRVGKMNIMPSENVLKQQMLDHMFSKHEQPVELLKTMGDRHYLQLLNPAELFLTFNRGELIRTKERAEGPGQMRYVIWWSCFDFASNRPLICILAFDYDDDAPELTEGSAALEDLWRVIKEEGSREATCLVIASQLDSRIKAVHPKILKRVRIGPILSKAFAKDRLPLLELVREYGDDEDFILLVKNEMICSKGETEPKHSLFGLLREKARQIFLIPETDLECYTAQVSGIRKMIYLPHHVFQKTDWTMSALKNIKKEYRSITFDRGGELFDL